MAKDTPVSATRTPPRAAARSPATAARSRAPRQTKAAPVRDVTDGDTAPSLRRRDIEANTINRATTGARTEQAMALADVLARHADGQGADGALAELQALMAGASPDDVKALRRLLFQPAELPALGNNADSELALGWREGRYPYKQLLSRRSYEREKYRLQVELLKLQAWVKDNGARVVILFEGRDAAGKGGTIKRLMEHLNPRGARVVALEKPSEVERGQWYFQRYIQHLPTRGEIVLFDRSWYNRAGVERVMGFCSEAEYDEFLRQTPEFERQLVRSGVHLFKFWFSVSRDEQRRRFKERKLHPPQAVEAEPHRPGQPGQMGRLHPGQGGDVPAHRHIRRAMDGDQERLQEARAAQRPALPAAPPGLCPQGSGHAGLGRPVDRRPALAGAQPGGRPVGRQRQLKRRRLNWRA